MDIRVSFKKFDFIAETNTLRRSLGNRNIFESSCDPMHKFFETKVGTPGLILRCEAELVKWSFTRAKQSHVGLSSV